MDTNPETMVLIFERRVRRSRCGQRSVRSARWQMASVGRVMSELGYIFVWRRNNWNRLHSLQSPSMPSACLCAFSSLCFSSLLLTPSGFEHNLEEMAKATHTTRISSLSCIRNRGLCETRQQHRAHHRAAKSLFLLGYLHRTSLIEVAKTSVV